MSKIMLKPRSERKVRAWRREWGCPRTKNRTPWCFGTCTPENGRGECGRIAPHALLGRTDLALLGWKARRAVGF